jgi:hypothetical protein
VEGERILISIEAAVIDRLGAKATDILNGYRKSPCLPEGKI